MINLVSRLDVEGRRLASSRRLAIVATKTSAPSLAKSPTATSIRSSSAVTTRAGSGDEEVPRLIEDELLASGVDAYAIKIIIDEQEAVDAGLRMAQRGDLLLIFGDATTRCWKQIVSFTPADASAANTERTRDVEVALKQEFSSPQLLDLPNLESLIIDERGARLAAEDSD